MRSDYYDAVSQAPLRPLTPKKKRRSKKRALLLLVGVIMLLLIGVAILAFRSGLGSPAAYAPPPEEKSDVPQTTIRRLEPPGEGAFAVAEGPGESLEATEIYERVIPSVLTVTAMDDYGGGGEGTGVIFDERGYFITNSHVIENNSMVFVTLSDGREYPASLIGMDRQTDLAVLHIPASGLTAAVFGSDTILRVGEPVYAVGDPLGSRFSGSMTDGIVSAINRNVWVDDREMSLIQTTAALNQGNSGGALVDSRGRVVGITNMKMMSMSSTVEGLGFAIPATTVVQVVNELMTHGYVTGRPMLGITVRPASQEESDRGGLYVESVEEASDAWAKGIRAGDILLAANGNRLRANQDLLTEKEELLAGDAIVLRWLSCGTGEEREEEILLVEQYELETRAAEKSAGDG